MAEAYSRYITYDPNDPTKKTGRHTPIDISNNPGVEVEGRYYSPNGNVIRKLLGTDSISINVPPNADSNDVQDTLKHELVHQAIQDKVPGQSDYASSFDASESSGDPSEGFYATDKGTPGNLWNWPLWRRRGDWTKEIPAYMSVYNPDIMKVDQPERDQYMSDLYNWQQNKGQTDTMKRVQHILQGREAYNGPDPVGSGRYRQKTSR